MIVQPSSVLGRPVLEVFNENSSMGGEYLGSTHKLKCTYLAGRESDAE